MLDVLRLADYAIVDAVELVCGPGLNVLTGETGAGKSIVVDALNLLLGARGSASFVRPGAAQAEIEGVFDLADSPAARAVLERCDLPSGDQLVLRRVLTATGKSRAYANGCLVPLSTMVELRDVLCDFHGQHDHQSLLRPRHQLDLLDAAAGLRDQRAKVATLAAQLQNAADHLHELREQQRTKNQRVEVLREDLERFGSVELEPGVEAAWRNERDRLVNADELRRLVAEVAAMLADADGDAQTVNDQVGRAAHSLRMAQSFDASLQAHVDGLIGAQEIVTDVAHALHRYVENLETDPAVLEEMQARLHTLDRLKRRYGVDDADDLITIQRECASELAQLEHMEHFLVEAEAAYDAVRGTTAKEAVVLSEARVTAARTLAKRVTTEIRHLGMPDAKLQIAVTRATGDQGTLDIDGTAVRLNATGIDRVDIQFSANAGMPLRPLREVASGGELSRVMLALKATQADTIPLLVFDEIDAGIGGNVGNAVADKLVALGATRQIFCVTHLPQIAARAATHWQVEKCTREGHTLAQVTPVRGDARAREVARMFGDEAAPETALEHAYALLSSSD